MISNDGSRTVSDGQPGEPAAPPMFQVEPPAAVYALEYLRAGLSVVPIRADGSKSPQGQWKRYQAERLDEAQVGRVFEAQLGVGIVCGAISGGLELFDFDAPGLFERWREKVDAKFPGLLDTLPIIRTPKGFSYHVYTRREKPARNQKLASGPDKETHIETRGEGGYALALGCPPKCHPLGKPYTQISGPPITSLPTIPYLTDEQYDFFIQAARDLDESVPDVEPVRRNGAAANRKPASGDRPGDRFNREATWEEILEPHGWTRTGGTQDCEYWRRAGKDEAGHSATIGFCKSDDGEPLLHVFSSNAAPFELEGTYSKFAAHTLLNHGGDYSRAAKSLAKSVPREHVAPAFEAPVLTAPDDDEIEQVLERAREAGSASPLLELIPELARMPQGEWLALAEQAKEILGDKFPKGEFLKALRAEFRSAAKQEKEEAAKRSAQAAAARREHAAQRLAESAESTDRNTIKLFDDAGLNRDPLDVHNAAVESLVARNKPVRLFVRGANLTRVISTDQGELELQDLDESALQSELLNAALFVGKSRMGEDQPVTPPTATLKSILGSDGLPFDRLRRIVHAPVLRLDGSVLWRPGYDKATQLLYAQDPRCVVPSIAERPSLDEVREAIELLKQPFAQFPFADDASRANVLALTLTGFLQPVVDNHRPLAAISARQRGSGKSLCSDVAAIVFTGREPTRTRMRRDEELEKKVAQHLVASKPHIDFDNVKVPLESATLESILTSRRHCDRLLGHNDKGFDVPQDAVWSATGNNLQLGSEMARRSYAITLDPKHPNPEDREGPRPGEKFVDLAPWVRKERGRLIWAVLTLCRAWWVGGQPDPGLPAFGSFDRWQRVVGGVLMVAGVEGFLTNRKSARDEQDEERREVACFLAAILRAFGGEASEALFTTAELVRRIERSAELAECLPEQLASIRATEHKSFAKALGSFFKSNLGAHVAADGLRVEREPDDSHHKVAQWRVVTGE